MDRACVRVDACWWNYIRVDGFISAVIILFLTSQLFYIRLRSQSHDLGARFYFSLPGESVDFS